MSADRKMIEGLAHKHAGLSMNDLFKHLDEHGGWPLGFKFLGFEHTDERKVGFTNSPKNSGWWTVVADADDYYMWKLSDEGLERIRGSIVITTSTSLTKRTLRSSRGYASFRD